MMTLRAVGLKHRTKMKFPDHPMEVTASAVKELKELIEPAVAMRPNLLLPALA